jgi:hypothetical protein
MLLPQVGLRGLLAWCQSCLNGHTTTSGNLGLIDKLFHVVQLLGWLRQLLMMHFQGLLLGAT